MDLETIANILLMLLCYVYILIVILISGNLDRWLKISQKTARKFLHVMIGNLPLIIPFFSLKIFPTLVAAPFILVTFLATPHSPFKIVHEKLSRLSEITEGGHQWGLVFYAISYTCLAFLFASKPHIIAVGIFPMAYGDAAASIIGGKHGRHEYKFAAKKSLEGSIAMFLTCFTTLTISMYFFSAIYPLSTVIKIPLILAACAVATLAEGLSPLGFDNLAVPALSVLTFIALGGGA